MNSKIFNIFLFLSLLFAGTASAKDVGVDAGSELWLSANESYTKEDYKGAIKLYNEVLDAGFDGEKLYYNLANSYYKDGNLGRAIVNYKRAQRLNPQDKDIAYNLAIASSQTKNIIESLPEFIMFTWFKGVRSMYSSNQWSIIGGVSFVLVFIFVLWYLLSTTVRMRKVSFTVAVVCLVLFGVTTSFAVHQKHEITDSSDAVVLSGSAVVKSSPDSNGKDIFIINEGALVEVIDTVGDWSKVTVISGNEGWILTKSIELI